MLPFVTSRTSLFVYADCWAKSYTCSYDLWALSLNFGPVPVTLNSLQKPKLIVWGRRSSPSTVTPPRVTYHHPHSLTYLFIQSTSPKARIQRGESRTHLSPRAPCDTSDISSFRRVLWCLYYLLHLVPLCRVIIRV